MTSSPLPDERMIDLTILPLENGGLELWQQDGQDEPDVIDLRPAQIRLLAERAGLFAAPGPKILDRPSAAHIRRLHALRDRIGAISNLADELIADLGIADGAQVGARRAVVRSPRRTHSRVDGDMSTGLLLFIDTETTGLPRWDLPADDPSQPRVVDLAGLLWRYRQIWCMRADQAAACWG